MNNCRDEELQSSAAWVPSPACISTTNIAWLMQRAGVDSYEALHAWSVQNRETFWALAIERLCVRLQKPFSRVMDLSRGVEEPRWLVDSRLNIVESCFTAPTDSPAIIHQPVEIPSGSDLEFDISVPVPGRTDLISLPPAPGTNVFDTRS